MVALERHGFVPTPSHVAGRLARVGARPRVLVTGAGGQTGRSVIRQLAAHDVPIVAVDAGPAWLSDVDTVYSVPEVADPERMSALRRIARDERVSLVIPTRSDELPQLSTARTGFGTDVDVVVASPGPVAIAHDRLYAAWHLQTRGVAVPPTAGSGDFVDGSGAFAALGGPLVFRTREGSGGSGRLVVVESPEQFDAAPPGKADFLQLYVNGPEYHAVLYRPRNSKEASPLLVILEARVHATTESGRRAVSVRRMAQPEASDVGRLAVAATRAIGLVGPSSVIIRRRVDGKPVVVEVAAGLTAAGLAVPELLERILPPAG